MRRARHDVGEVGVRAEPAGDQRRERGAEQERRADRRWPAVTPSSATAAPSAADASATPASAGRGGRTIPSGVSVSESSITPSARGSDGPGTNVDDDAHRDRQALLRGPRRDRDLRRPRSRRCDGWVRTRTPSTKKRRSGLGAPPARAPRTRTSSSQSTWRSMSARSIVSVSPVHANVRPVSGSRSDG